MTARIVILPAALAGCAPPEEAPKAEEKPPAEAKKPKTPAELLVGTWVMDESNKGHAFPESSRMQFTADGHWFDRVNEPLSRPKFSSGTYTLAGDTLRYHLEFMDTPDSTRGDADTQIIFLTDDRFIELYQPDAGGKRARTVWKRVAAK